ALMVLFIRGRLIPESRNPISRITQAIYLPVLRLCLRFRKTTLLLNLVVLIVTLPLALHIGSQFMPPLFEGSALYMPTALPGISIGQASQLLQEQDRIIRTFPEVETVFGSIGRSDSATDNAPLDMYDTTLMLKPRSQWRPGMTYEKLIQEMDAKLQFPGLSNTWTMPVENRLDMELTGIKTPLGMKIQGPTLEGIQQTGAQIQQVLSGLPQVRSVFSERVSQGFYVNIDLNARNYGDFVKAANDLLKQKLHLPAGNTYKWAGEYEFELRAKERLRVILPVVFFVIFVLLYMVFHSVAESGVLIFPTLYALTGGLILQEFLGYNFSVAVWVGYIALFGIAVETGVVMLVYLHEALNRRLASGQPLRHADIEQSVIEGAVQHLPPKLMTVCVVLASLIPILGERGIGSDV